jgi:hypothetical protein
LERSDPTLITVGGTTGQRKSVDPLDEYIQGRFWQRARQGMSRGQVVLGNIQCRVVDRAAGCADQLPCGLVGIPGQFIRIGGLPELPFGGMSPIHQVIGGAASQCLPFQG